MKADAPIDGFIAPEGSVFELQPPGSRKSFTIRPKRADDQETGGEVLCGDKTMKDFDIVVEGEHISNEVRNLRFGEVQVNSSVDEGAAGDDAFDHAECSKWFRLDTVSVYIVGYDVDGKRKTIVHLYKNGHIVDDGFEQVFSSPESRVGPFVSSRRAKRQCKAWGEIHDEYGFRMDRLKIYKGIRTWDDGKKVISLIDFEYDGEEIILADETDAEACEQYIQETKLVDGLKVRDVFKTLGIAGDGALAKEYIEVEDGTGATRGFYRLGYEIEREDEGVMICVNPKATAQRNGARGRWLFPCCRVKEWKVVRSGIAADNRGEYIVADPEVRHVATIESLNFWFDIREDWVWALDEDGNAEPVEIASIDKRKAMADISDGRAGRARCVRLLRELDVHCALRNIDDECLLAIWTSKDVPCVWKYETLERLADRKTLRNTVLVPIEFKGRGEQMSARRSAGEVITATVDYVISLLFENDFAMLDELAATGELADVEARWHEIVLRLMLCGDYDPCGACGENGTAFLDRAIAWIDKFRPGVLAAAADKYGNNIAMYVYAATEESKYPPKDYWARDEAVSVLDFLAKFGCDANSKNCFGVSALMLLADR